MKENINLIILPLYRNKEDYPYSLFYLLNNDKNTLDLSKLENLLFMLNSKFNINKISIEGGEISELSDIYFSLLFNLLKIYNKKIQITTDFINFNKSLINGADIIDIQFDFDSFTHHIDMIKKNIKAATTNDKIINIKSLDISVNKNELENIKTLNNLGIKSWKIIPYIKTRYNIFNEDLNVTYENVIIKYLKLIKHMKFSFINKLELENIIQQDNFPINTIYITPNNKFGLGKFDNNNCFYLEEYDNLEDLEKNLKDLQNKNILLCKDCDFKLNCLAERYFNPNDLSKSHCNFKNLMKYIKGK